MPNEPKPLTPVVENTVPLKPPTRTLVRPYLEFSGGFLADVSALLPKDPGKHEAA
jgi:hypothetical protein